MTILDGADLNTINKIGFYAINNPLNAPSGILNWWVNMIVLNTGGSDAYAMQILIPHVSTVNPDIYIRISVASKWEDWHKLSATSVE